MGERIAGTAAPAPTSRGNRHRRRSQDHRDLYTPGVAPVLGRTIGGAITFSRPERNHTSIALTRSKTERGYTIFMGALRNTFPGWRPEWRDAAGLNDWLDRMRARMPVPCPPSITAGWGSTSPLVTYAGPLVYFIRISDMIKIGYSGNLRERVAGLGVTMAQVIGVEPGDPDREAELHRQFAHLREFGEWFRAEPELLTYVATLEAESAA